MSGYLNIFGLAVPVGVQSASRGKITIGVGLQRKSSAKLSQNWNAKKWHVAVKCAPQVQGEAVFMRAILEGEFDHWYWDSNIFSDDGLHSDKGNGSTTAVNVDTSPETGPYSGDAVLGATTGDLRYADAWGDDGGTVMVMRLESAVWHDYAIVYAPGGAFVAAYKDGSPISIPSSWFVNMGVGGFQIKNTSGSPVSYAELVVVEAPMPASMALAVATFRLANPWAAPLGGAYTGAPCSEAPELYCKGDFNPYAIAMEAQVSDSGILEAQLGGTFNTNNELLSFDLLGL